MAEILFTHSYFLRFDPKEFRAMTPYPRSHALCRGRRAGGRYSVGLFDSMLANDESEILSPLGITPRVLVIYDDDFNYLTKMCLTRIGKPLHARAHGGGRMHLIVHGSDPRPRRCVPRARR